MSRTNWFRFASDGGEGSSAVAEAPATPVKKKAAKRKPAAKKKAAKKKVKKAKVKKSNGGGGRSDDSRDTIRLRMFKALKKAPNGLTGAEIKDKLELSGVPNILRDEGIMAKPARIKRADIEGKRGVVYQLTAAGRQALEKGTVNSGAPESAGGKEWKD